MLTETSSYSLHFAYFISPPKGIFGGVEIEFLLRFCLPWTAILSFIRCSVAMLKTAPFGIYYWMSLIPPFCHAGIRVGEVDVHPEPVCQDLGQGELCNVSVVNLK